MREPPSCVCWGCPCRGCPGTSEPQALGQVTTPVCAQAWLPAGTSAEPAHASLPSLRPCLLCLLSLLSHKALTSKNKPWEAEVRWGLGWCPAGNRHHCLRPQLGELGLKTAVAPDVLQSHTAVKGLRLRDSTQTPDSSKFPENGR